jgi:hypothetical protein
VAAPVGNQFWKVRSSHGRDKIFSTPEVLWDAACEYFEWVENNPLMEEKAFHFQGAVVKDSVCKMRAMTISGLCLFLGIGAQTLRDYENDEDFSAVIRDIKTIIYEQKFSGAAADLLNPNIIARDLGLSDKQDLNHSGRIDSNQNIKQITADMSADEATRIYQDMLNGTD